MNEATEPTNPPPPLPRQRPPRGIPEYLTWAFMAISIAVFFYQWQFHGGAGRSGYFSGDDLRQGNYLGLITHQFVHGGHIHLICNMLTLFYFGPAVVRFCGPLSFILCYFIGGIVAALSEVALPLGAGPQAILVGASGAISALFGLWAARMPAFRISLILFFIIPIKGKLISIALGWVALNVILAVVTKDSAYGNIAWIAHAGGTVWGLVQGFLFHKRIHPEEPGQS